MGCMLVPFTARGVTEDDGMLSGCSLSCSRRVLPATHMSAPESGSTRTVAAPLREVMCTEIVAAGRKCDEGWSFADAMRGAVETARDPGMVPSEFVCGGGGPGRWRCDLHTLWKCPTLWQP